MGVAHGHAHGGAGVRHGLCHGVRSHGFVEVRVWIENRNQKVSSLSGIAADRCAYI